MKIFKWVKNHPVEAAAIAAGLAIGGPAVFAALAPEAAAGAAGAGALAGGGAEASLFGAGVAAAPETAFGGAAFGADAAAGAGGSALLSAYPAGEDFAAQMAGNTIAGGDASALLAPYGDPSAIAGRFATPGGAEASLYGPNVGTDPATALDSSTWLDKLGNKLKDPKTIMRLGMMASSLGSPQQQGGPAPMQTPAPMRSAIHSQEEITKAWLMRNDPNTYRRIYGSPQQGVA